MTKFTCWKTIRKVAASIDFTGFSQESVQIVGKSAQNIEFTIRAIQTEL